MRAFASLLIAAILICMPSHAEWVGDEHQIVFWDISITYLKETRCDYEQITRFICLDFFRKRIAEPRLVMISEIRWESIINTTYYKQSNSLRAALSDYSLHLGFVKMNSVLRPADSSDIRPNLVGEEKELHYVEWLSSDLIAPFALDLNRKIPLLAPQILRPSHASIEGDEPLVRCNVACRCIPNIFDTIANIHASAVLVNGYAVTSDRNIDPQPRSMARDESLFRGISAISGRLDGRARLAHLTVGYGHETSSDGSEKKRGIKKGGGIIGEFPVLLGLFFIPLLYLLGGFGGYYFYEKRSLLSAIFFGLGTLEIALIAWLL